MSCTPGSFSLEPDQRSFLTSHRGNNERLDKEIVLKIAGDKELEDLLGGSWADFEAWIRKAMAAISSGLSGPLTLRRTGRWSLKPSVRNWRGVAASFQRRDPG